MIRQTIVCLLLLPFLFACDDVKFTGKTTALETIELMDSKDKPFTIVEGVHHNIQIKSKSSKKRVYFLRDDQKVKFKIRDILMEEENEEVTRYSRGHYLVKKTAMRELKLTNEDVVFYMNYTLKEDTENKFLYDYSERCITRGHHRPRRHFNDRWGRRHVEVYQVIHSRDISASLKNEYNKIVATSTFSDRRETREVSAGPCW